MSEEKPVYSWAELLSHEPVGPYKPAKSDTLHCNLCKSPLSTEWHREPLFATSTWRELQNKFFDIDERSKSLQTQMREYRISINPDLMAIERLQKIVTLISAQLFLPEEILAMEIAVLTQMFDSMQQNFEQLKSQLKTPSLHVAKKPQNLFIPGQN